MTAVVERVDRLEEVLEDFVTNVGIEFNKLYNSQMRTEAELRAFKDEMRAFKDEMRVQNREMNRKWGDMSNKLGTMVEDLVAPSLQRIIEESLQTPVIEQIIRRKRRLPDGRVKEFDAIALTADLVCLNSTKATLRSADVDHFIEDIAAFRAFFPEYDDRALIGILASLDVDASVLAYAETKGFLVIAIGDQLMEVKNRPGFEPRRWT